LDQALPSPLAVVGLLATVAEMLEDGEQVQSLEAFLQLAVVVAGIIIMWVRLADQVLEALKEAMEVTVLQLEHPDKASVVELTPQELLVAEVELEA
jgi:hypothetical protein